MTADELAAMIAEEIDNNSGTRAILAKVQRGTATLADSERFTGITAEITGRLLADNVLSLPLSDRQGAFVDITAARYRDTFSVFSAVQRALDERLGINLAVMDPGFEKARAQKAGHALADQTVPESTVQRRAESAGENIVRSQHDRIVQKQAEFRDRAGLQSSAIREGGAKCCEWCASVSGKYPASDTPQGFWGRHDNCKCSILYETRKGVQRLGGSTKKWEPLEDVGAPEPTRLTAEQAAEREAQHPVIAFSPEQAKSLQESVLTNGANRAKMGVEYDSIELFKGADALTEQDAKTLDDAISVIPANLLQKLSEHVASIEIVEGRGYSSYNTENRKIFLDSETASRNIVHELGHAFGAMLNLYEDPEFLRIIAKGLDLQDWGRVAIGKHPSDGSTIFYYKDSSKFIFPYQGRLYAHPDSIGKGNIDPACFREYISVGFDLYFHRPKILKTRDPDLYHYLEVLINGFTDSSNEGAN